MAMTAFRCIHASPSLPKLLECILAVGNYINATATPGFRVSFLEKIASVRGSKTTALGVVASFMRDEVGMVLDECKPARHRICMSHFEAELGEMRKLQRVVDDEIDVVRGEGEEVYAARLESFWNEMSKGMRVLKQDMQTFEEEIENVRVYFGEQDSKVTAEEILAGVCAFLQALEKEARQVKVAKPKKVVETVEAKKENQGHLDELLDSLKSRPVQMSIDAAKQIKRRDVAARRGKGIERKSSMSVIGEATLSLLQGL
jgi:Formin Homology 2 Domain